MPESIVTHINDKIDMMMFELDNEDCTRKLLPSTDNQFLHFSRKVAETASTMRRPVDIQLGISCGNPFSPPKPTKKEQQHQPHAIKNQIDHRQSHRQYMFHEQFHERNHFIPSLVSIITAPKHSPSLDRLISDVLAYIDSCPEQTVHSDDLRSLIEKLKKD